MKKTSRQFIMGITGIILLVVLDQLTKVLAAAGLKDQTAFVLIPGVFEFRYLENQSAAFSLDIVSILQRIFHFARFENDPEAFLRFKMIFFVILTIIVVAILIRIYAKVPQSSRFLPLNLILLFFTAGAIGNMIDRALHQYVIDFFYFRLINFPIFNVADIYVTVAAFGLILCFLFYYKEEDFDQIFPSSPKKKA